MENTQPDNTPAKKTDDAAAAKVEKPKKEDPIVRRFVLSSSPHIRSRESVTSIMWTVTLTLLPATVAATYFFGFRALMLVLFGIAGAAVAEMGLQKIFKMPMTVSDGSAVLTGLLVSFNIPAGTPWWIPFIGGIFAIAIGKMPFGGLGYNPLNPALLGRAFLLASWPVHMTKDWLPAFWWKDPRFGFFAWNVNPADAFTYATPLEARRKALDLVAEGGDAFSQGIMQYHGLGDLVRDLVVGRVGGCIGETSALLLLIGAAYLLYKNYIDWRTPFAFIGVVALGGWMFGGPEGLFTGNALFHIFAGGLILGAFYMATDMVTTPITPKGRLIFGAGCGLITLMIRMIGGYPEGVSYAILLMNLVTPLIDRYVRPRRFGHVQTAKG